MDLKPYISNMPEPDRELFAKKCGTTLGHMRNVMYRYKPCAPELAVAIWKESNGAVTREELRPDDFWRFWPDLTQPKRSKPTTKTEA